MKDEIKEINITFPGQILDYVDTKEHLLELFNYITNLQARNEKAIEYIIENSEMYDEDLCTSVRFELRDLLDILQREDNTQENLYKYTPEKGFRLVGDEDVKNKR